MPFTQTIKTIKLNPKISITQISRKLKIITITFFFKALTLKEILNQTHYKERDNLPGYGEVVRRREKSVDRLNGPDWVDGILDRDP